MWDFRRVCSFFLPNRIEHNKLNNLIKYEWNFHFLLLRHRPVVVPVVWRKMWRMCMRWHLWLKYQRTWIIDRLISFEVKASKGLLHHIKASKIKNDFELFASYIFHESFSILSKNKSCRSDILIMDFSRYMLLLYRDDCDHTTIIQKKRGF